MLKIFENRLRVLAFQAGVQQQFDRRRSASDGWRCQPERLEDFPGATPLQKFEDAGTGLPSETCECHQLGVADAKSQSENSSPSGNGLGFLGHRLECFVTKRRKQEFRFTHIVPVFGSFPAFRIHFLSRSQKSSMKGKKEVAGGGFAIAWVQAGAVSSASLPKVYIFLCPSCLLALSQNGEASRKGT